MESKSNSTGLELFINNPESGESDNALSVGKLFYTTRATIGIHFTYSISL
jgi:hypothetical protein